MARRWYGADWWFVSISAVAVVFFIVVALFPGLFAPYSPDALVGPRFLAPLAEQNLPILVVPKNSPINTLQDLAVPAGTPNPGVSVVQGVPTASALNEQSQQIDAQIKNEPSGLRLRPLIDRYPTLDQALQAVVDGTDKAAVIQTSDLKILATDYPTLRQAESITGQVATASGFLLGTNDIGQDVFSRLIWGTRIALLSGSAPQSFLCFWVCR